MTQGMKLWKNYVSFPLNCTAKYSDDIIVLSKMAENHLDHLEKVFFELQQADMKMKASECLYLSANELDNLQLG